MGRHNRERASLFEAGSEEPVKNGRQEVIDQVTQAVMSDRNVEYAPPEQNFQRIADLWNTYLEGRTVTPYDTAIMMALVKVARAMTSPHQLDHVVDIAGYAACAADVLPERETTYEEDVAAVSDLSRGEPEPEPDPGKPLRYNGEDGRLFAPTDPDSDRCVWLSAVSGKKAVMSGRDWELAIDAGAARFLSGE